MGIKVNVYGVKGERLWGKHERLWGIADCWVLGWTLRKCS